MTCQKQDLKCPECIWRSLVPPLLSQCLRHWQWDFTPSPSCTHGGPHCVFGVHLAQKLHSFFYTFESKEEILKRLHEGGSKQGTGYLTTLCAPLGMVTPVRCLKKREFTLAFQRCVNLNSQKKVWGMTSHHDLPWLGFMIKLTCELTFGQIYYRAPSFSLGRTYQIMPIKGWSGLPSTPYSFTFTSCIVFLNNLIPAFKSIFLWSVLVFDILGSDESLLCSKIPTGMWGVHQFNF